MSTHTVKIGSDVQVGQIAHGLMMLTWTDNPGQPALVQTTTINSGSAVPYEQAFDAIKAGIDSLPTGVKMMLNSGEFYDNKFLPSNLDLLAAFFEKYPDYADKTFLSVKGGLVENGPIPDSSPQNLRRSVDRINKHLRGTKKLDLFEAARVDPKVPIEDAIRTLAELIKEEKFSYIGLSEASEATLRRASAVHPIAAIEIEISPWSYEDETKKVIAAAKELGTVVVGYSPLGRGFLTGQIKSRADLPDGDMRLHYTRFSEENIQHNLKIVDELNDIARKKGISTAQLSLAWIGALGNHIVPIPGSSRRSRTLENLAAAKVTLTPEEFEAVNKIIAAHGVRGDRYFGEDVDALTWG